MDSMYQGLSLKFFPHFVYQDLFGYIGVLVVINEAFSRN